MSSASPKPIIKIENIVATVSIDQRIDLEEIERRLNNVEYEPEQFPGLIFRLEQPRVTALIFKSGKMVITGAKSTEELIRAVKTIFAILKREGIIEKARPRIQIQNIVASANLNVQVDLEKAAYLLENSMYEPEQFPGLIYRLDEPRVVLLLFSSGKMVITGAKREEEVKKAVDRVYKKLEELECIRKMDEEDLSEEELFED
ncbi:TATA-box-binding protein [Ignicoccus islandicus DSM 13165]|uniref:TATA-box-binding protein n=1 Tax=Ignicoccus islandicus DSM 13165 TaxID=940295 RepID=A0A0U3FNR7_9CREN|nr:TATA-box-binding protein [Ignicoccus islandicus]ALU11623.1 TATA-box-binding protein [Ignicoccus islandicus DSM 13165]